MPTPDVFAAKVVPLQARRLPVRAVSLRIAARFERKRGFVTPAATARYLKNYGCNVPVAKTEPTMID